MAGIVYATVLDTYFLNNINVRYFVIQGTCITVSYTHLTLPTIA